MKRSSESFRRVGWEGISLIGVVVLALISRTAVAQLPTATILGVIKDSTGAVVPEATLTARNVETGLIRTTVSSGDGSFRLAALQIGSYEVRAEHAGFRSQLRSGLTLTVSQEAVINFTLEVGAVEQTVAVTAEAPLVEVTSGALGGLVDERKVSELPLNGRNFMNLTLLQTGVQITSVSAGGGGGPIMRGLWISSNGGTGRSNAYLIDGAPMQNLNGNSPMGSVSDSSLGVEGIQEFRMVTNSFSAEYGMVMGSTMVVVSKNGTNSVHGSLLEFHRDSALAARDFFDYKTDITPRRLPALTRNNFGGSLGGPIRRDHTFFHVVFEGLKQRLGRTSNATVIPPESKVDGGLVPQISPTIKPFLNLWPNPNLPGNRYTYPSKERTDENYGQTRVDHSFSSNDNLFGRYTISDTTQTFPFNFGTAIETRRDRAQFVTLSETHVFSPVLLNTGRLSYSRTTIRGNSPTGLGCPVYCFVQGFEMGSFSVGSGITGIGASSVEPIHHKQNIFTLSDDAFYNKGSHALKFGTLINRYRMYILSAVNMRGAITFANLAAFLQGGPVVSITAITPNSIMDKEYVLTTLGTYLQDDWRVSPTLTLNLGLRYEPTTTVTERNHREYIVRDLLRDATTTEGPPFQNPSLRNISPRIGLAWDVRGDGQTAVRAGFAILQDVVGYGGALLSHNNTPLATQSSLANVATLQLPLVFPASAAGKTIRQIDWLLQQPHMLQYNFTVERQLPFLMALRASYVGSRGINLIQRYDANPALPQVLSVGRHFWTGNEPRQNPNWDYIGMRSGSASSWYNSLQIELRRRLDRGFQLQTAYTYSKSIDTNPGQISGDSQDKVADSTNRIMDKALSEFSIPHNLRLNLIYHLPARISSGGALAKVANGWWLSGILSLNSGFPFNVGVTGNWSRSKMNIGGLGGLGERPDILPGVDTKKLSEGVSKGCPIVGGTIPAGTPLGTRELYFDPCVFTLAEAGFNGNLGRNVLRGPGIATLDFSLAKDTALAFLGEGGNLQFRAEAFNMLNRVNFGQPSSTVFAGRAAGEAPNATTGQINSTRGTSRQFQLGLRLIF